MCLLFFLQPQYDWKLILVICASFLWVFLFFWYANVHWSNHRACMLCTKFIWSTFCPSLLVKIVTRYPLSFVCSSVLSIKCIFLFYWKMKPLKFWFGSITKKKTTESYISFLLKIVFIKFDLIWYDLNMCDCLRLCGMCFEICRFFVFFSFIFSSLLSVASIFLSFIFFRYSSFFFLFTYNYQNTITSYFHQYTT